MRGIAFIVGAAVLSGTSSVAHACSVVCLPGAVGLEVWTNVPANAPGFPFRPTASYGVPVAADAGSPTAMALLGVNGEEISIRLVPSLNGNFFVVPDAPLKPGQYSFSFFSDCALRSRTALPFRAIEPVPFPENAGTLNITYEKRSVSVPTSAGNCYDQHEAATAKLAVTPSDALKPWLPLSRWIVHVDGERWTENANASTSFPPPASGNLVVYAGCTTTDAGGFVGLRQGKHRVSITAEISNGPSTQPLERDIDLQCDSDSDDGCSITPSKSSERSVPFALILALGFGTVGASRYLTKRIRREPR
jgi:hypothetical protein